MLGWGGILGGTIGGMFGGTFIGRIMFGLPFGGGPRFAAFGGGIPGGIRPGGNIPGNGTALDPGISQFPEFPNGGKSLPAPGKNGELNPADSCGGVDFGSGHGMLVKSLTESGLPVTSSIGM